MSEADVLPSAFVLLCGSVALFLYQMPFSVIESRIFGASFVAHLVSAAVQLWLVTDVYGVGDQLVYFRIGQDLAGGMREDFFVVVPEVAKVALQQDFRLSIYVPAQGTPIATMCALTGFVTFVVGDSLLAVSLVFALAGLFGKLLLYEGLKRIFPENLHPRLLLVTMLVPSTVFWSAGIVKEAIAMAGLGPTFLGMVRLTRGERAGWLPMAVGAITISLVKPYILMAFAGSAGLYVYWRRSIRNGRVTVRPVMLLLSVAVAIGGIALIGEIFPRYSLEGLMDETARLQSAGFSNKHGSNYQIGDPTNRTVLGQLLFAPVALFTALYRPLIIEVSNPMMLVNALETSALLGYTLWIGLRSRLTSLIGGFVRHPGLVFCIAFVVLLGVPVGLTSANLGTLSRYRIPLVPFQAALMIVLGAVAHFAPSPTTSSSAAVPGRTS